MYVLWASTSISSLKNIPLGIKATYKSNSWITKKSKPDSSTSYIYVDSDAAMVMQLKSFL